MKNKYILSILCVLLAVSFMVNSCKKDNQLSLVKTFFNDSKWQLATVERKDKLNGLVVSDTTYAPCDLNQYFTFSSNNTCTYTNYHCISQAQSGTWALTNFGLYLTSNIALQDTISADSCCKVTHPFQYVEISTVGNYSLILRTGDIGSFATTNLKATIYLYGFVRVTPPPTNQ